MSDEEQNRQQEATAREEGTDDNMDLDDGNARMSDSDDEDFQMANEVPDAPVVARNLRVRPQRVQVNEGAEDEARHEMLFNAFFGRFIQNYRVLSARHLDATRGHANVESGGKVILPPEALDQLSRSRTALMGPMMFKATNRHNGKSTHCGVLEFIANWGHCYMPSWMMELIGAYDYGIIQFERVELPTATFAKFQPQSVDFLEISDPRAVLENTLRHFACLSKGDIITIPYNSRKYQLLVLETLPRDAVTIIECDMNVDFAAPVGYVSPSASNSEQAVEEVSASKSPFTGNGNRLNGGTVEASEPSSGTTGNKATPRSQSSAHAPDTDWMIGTLRFTRKIRKPSSEEKSATGGGGGGGGPRSDKKFTAFGGMGMSLRSLRKHKITDDLS